MFGFGLIFTQYECACCHRYFGLAEYQKGAFYCLECARGEHRHPRRDSKAA